MVLYGKSQGFPLRPSLLAPKHKQVGCRVIPTGGGVLHEFELDEMQLFIASREAKDPDRFGMRHVVKECLDFMPLVKRSAWVY